MDWGYGAKNFKQALFGLLLICVFLALGPTAIMVTGALCSAFASSWCTQGQLVFIIFVLLLAVFFAAVFIPAERNRKKHRLLKTESKLTLSGSGKAYEKWNWV